MEHRADEAEDRVLGSLLLARADVIDEVEEIIGPKGDAFYRESSQLIYRAVLALRSDQKPTDAVAVQMFLATHGMIDQIGGVSRLVALASTVPAVTNVGHYANIVMETAQMRAISIAAMEIQRLVETNREGRTMDEVHDEVERLIVGARDAHRTHKAEQHTGFQLAEYLDHRMRNPQQDEEGIPTPFEKVPMFQGGRMYVLAGYQADGKTALAAEFIRCASDAGRKVGFATYEMGWQDVAVRMASTLGAPAKQIETGRITTVDKPRVAAAIAKLATMNVTVTFEYKPTVSALARFQRRNRFDFLVVDHLHQFHIDDPRYERQYLERIVREIQGLAVAENIPILLLAQLSRVGDPKNPYPRPTMASLRGTAMIEALAWCVWFVWRHRDKKNLPTSESEFITAKNRSGRPGFFDMTFHDRQVRFTENRDVAP